MTTAARIPSTVAERVDFIADLMAKGLYITRVTAKQLAAEWGVAKTTVEHYAGEASRMVRADRGSLEQIRDGQLAKLEMIVMQAIAKKEFRTAVAAIEASAKIAGTMAAQRHEISGVLVSAAWIELRGQIMRVLDPFPQARDALLEALAAAGDKDAATPVLTAGPGSTEGTS